MKEQKLINFTNTLAEKKLKDIENKNMENKFFLATATTWNYEKTKPDFDFFTNGINVLFDYEKFKSKFV